MSHDDLSSFELSGEYLALTGARLNAKEMISAGLATHFVSSEVRHSAASISTSIRFAALIHLVACANNGNLGVETVRLLVDSGCL